MRARFNHILARVLTVLLAVMTFSGASAQSEYTNPAQSNIAYPQNSSGLPIKEVVMIIDNSSGREIADSATVERFGEYFGIYPGSTFNQSIMSAAIKGLESNPHVKSAAYTLYHSAFGAPLTVIVNITLLKPGEHKTVGGKSGMAETRSLRDFPLIYESDAAQLSVIMNGAVGLFNDHNSFFCHGRELNEGNPIATDPAGAGTRFWGEAYLEPGLSGIIRIPRTDIYAYGAVSGLFSGRNTSDVYSSGGSTYTDFEKLYAGILFTRMGRNRDMNLNLSYGRQDFQLNDGFLISRFSGSANAGKRASVYLNSRVAYSRVGLVRFTMPRWSAEAFYIMPQEMTRHHEQSIAYAGAYAGFNDNRHWDVGLAFIDRVGGKGDYATTGSERKLQLKGLYVINPKIWINDIAGTGLFFKTEYAYEAHHDGGMSANAFYVGAGIDLKKTVWSPRLYYRYAFMQGDKGNTDRYTRFDPVLAGGLAEWVQGITMCKLFGHGNITTHRLQAQLHPSDKVDAVIDYHHLRADTYNNLGGAAPLSTLKSKHLGDELTIQSHWYINDHFMLLGLASWAFPGKALKEAFESPVKCWSTYQLSLFMFF